MYALFIKVEYDWLTVYRASRHFDVKDRLHSLYNSLDYNNTDYAPHERINYGQQWAVMMPTGEAYKGSFGDGFDQNLP